MASFYKGLNSKKEIIDAGTKIGAATIIAETDTGTRGERRFSVRCECGSIRTINIRLLRKIRKGVSKGRCRKCAYKKR